MRERPSNRAAARAHRPSNSLDAPFCAFNYSLARKAKKNTRARTPTALRFKFLISFSDVLFSQILSAINRRIRQMKYICIIFFGVYFFTSFSARAKRP